MAASFINSFLPEIFAATLSSARRGILSPFFILISDRAIKSRQRLQDFLRKLFRARNVGMSGGGPIAFFPLHYVQLIKSCVAGRVPCRRHLVFRAEVQIVLQPPQ